MADASLPGVLTYYAPANSRALVVPGVPVDHTYTFSVRAYRRVDTDVDADGVILSNPIGANPYKPANYPAYKGDIIGTIMGREALLVVQNLEAIASDGVLSTAEKPGLILSYNQAASQHDQLLSRSSIVGGLTAQRNALIAARTSLDSYLNGLTPSWSDTTSHTAIAYATFQSRWASYYAALADLDQAITGVLDGRSVGDNNRVRFSMFESGIVGWKQLTTAGTFVAEEIQAFAPLRYYVVRRNWTAQNQTFSIGPDRANSNIVSRVTPLERIFASCKLSVDMAGHQQTYSIRLWFSDSAHNIVGSSVLIGTGTGVDPGSVRQGAFATVPATAAYAWIEVYVTNNATAATYCTLFLTEPMICSAAPNQTAWPNFTPGPSNEFGADVTTEVSGPVAVDVPYDHTGTVPGPQFDLIYKLVSGSGAVTDGVTSYCRIISGTVNGVTAANGNLPLTVTGGSAILPINNMSTSQVVMDVYLVRNGRERRKQLTLTRVLAAAPAPSGSTGGTSTASASQTSGFGQILTPWTSQVAISNVIALQLPTGKTTVRISVSLAPRWSPKNQAQNGPWNIEYQLQRNTGTTASPVWSPIGGLVNSNPDPEITDANYDSQGGTPLFVSNAGDATFSFDDTGRTAGQTYEYRLLARVSSGSTTSNTGGITHTGSITLTVP